MENLMDRKVFESVFGRYILEKKHLMLLYDDLADYRYVASRFIAQGLQGNDCCLMALDAYRMEDVLHDLAALGVDGERHLASGRLVLIDVQANYAAGQRFEPEATLRRWQEVTNQAVLTGFDHLRAVGEATFAVGHPDVGRELIRYENLLNEQLFPDYPFMSLCVYDKNAFSDEVLKAAIQSHPMLVNGTKVYKHNIYYVPPKIFFSKEESHSEIDRWLSNMDSSNELVQQIVASEERFAQALDAISDGVWEYDVDTKTLFYSQRWAELLGYSVDASVSLEDFHRDNILPEDHALFEQGVANFLQGHVRSFEAEIRLRTMSGDIKWVFARGRAVEVDGDGLPVRVVGALSDITKRKQAEAEGAESEQLFRMLYEDAPVAYQSLDAGGNFISVNKAFCKTLGYEAEELIGRNFSELLHPEWVDHFRENFPRFKAIGEILGVEFEMRRKDGAFILVSFIGRIGKTPEGDFRQTHCVFRDISTERMREQELIKAKEAAEQASLAKSMFLANMSHELRTPLNGIMGMHQLLQVTPLDEEQSEYVQMAILSAKRLTELLSDILDLTRIEAGKVKVANKPFDLRRMVHLVEQLFTVSAGQKGVKLSMRVDPAIPCMVCGDSARLQQILNNLVGNAVKFTEQGRVQVDVSLIPSTCSCRQRVLFTVRDTGIGMPEELIDFLFQSFTQVDEGFRRAYQGAGLGLAIVKDLVALMGGNLSVVSEQGMGTIFYVTVPLEACEVSAMENREVTLSCPATKPKLPVLLAEDDKVNRLAVMSLLGKAGYTVHGVTNGEEAVQALMDREYSMVLMDIQMPVMDGVETAQAIRDGAAGDINRHIPIVALTAYAMTGDREMLLDGAMDDYVSKPVDVVRLTGVMDRLLGHAVN